MSLDLTLPLPAAEAWRLHRDFGFTSFSAAIDEQSVEMVEETATTDGSGNVRVQRVFKMVFLTDPVPGPLRGLVQAEKIQPILREAWDVEARDGQFSYQFSSEVPFFGDKLRVTARQWFRPLTDSTCSYVSRAEITATYFPGMNGLLERAAAEKLEWAMSTFGDRAVEFQATAAGLPRSPRAWRGASLPGSPQVAVHFSPPRNAGSASVGGAGPRPLAPKDAWLPELYEAAAVAAAPTHRPPGSAPISTALELEVRDSHAPAARLRRRYARLFQQTHLSLTLTRFQRRHAPSLTQTRPFPTQPRPSVTQTRPSVTQTRSTSNATTPVSNADTPRP